MKYQKPEGRSIFIIQSQQNFALFSLKIAHTKFMKFVSSYVAIFISPNAWKLLKLDSKIEKN